MLQYLSLLNCSFLLYLLILLCSDSEIFQYDALCGYFQHCLAHLCVVWHFYKIQLSECIYVCCGLR